MQERTDNALTPIKGITYPLWHTDWCDVAGHRRDWAEIITEGYDLDAPPCRLHIAADFMPAIYRCGTDASATRESQGVWCVELERHRRVDPKGTDYVEDSVVVLSQDRTGENLLRLMPGEARSLAAALLKAADVDTFSFLRSQGKS